LADSTIPNLDAVTTPVSTDVFRVRQAADTRDKKMTRAQIYTGESGEQFLFDGGTASLPGISFNGDPDTGFFSESANQLRASVAGVNEWTILTGRTQGVVADAFAIMNETASAINPTLCPSRSDLDTGVGRQGADNGSLIAGGAEAIRFEDPADLQATETSLWLYDDDNGAIQQVTVGIADSGGSGFKLLRIVN